MSAETDNDTSPTKQHGRFDLIALATSVILALTLRLPGLTAFITADEARSWFGRSIIFLDSLLRGDLANTAPGGEVAFIENVSLSPAPGVTTMWTGAIGIILEYVKQGMPGSLTEFLVNMPFDPLDPAMLFWLRLPNALLATLAVGLTYWWSRPLLGRWAAFLGALFMAIDPFYLALSRILGHDALVTTFMWLSLLAFLRVAQQQIANRDDKETTPYAIRNTQYTSFLILSGAFAGLAVLSKYPALFMGAFIALALLVIYLGQTRALSISVVIKRWFIDLAIWSIAAGIIFALFWPAMWVNPLGPVTAIISDALRASGGVHQKGSFFLGQPVPDPGILFYPLIFLLRTTPVVLVGCLLAVGGLFFRCGQKETKPYAIRNTRYVFFILLAYILFYTLLVTYGGKKQDRYILPIFPALTMLAAMGYVYVSSVRSRFTFHVSRFIFTTLIISQIFLVLPTYPYYFSYYNPLAGGSALARRTVQVGWGEGLNEVAAYLNTLPAAETTKVVSWYSTTFEPYFKGEAIYKIEDEKISRSAKPGLAADYVVLYVNQLQRRLPSEGALAYFQQNEPIHTVSINGQDYAWIYPAPGVSHIIKGEARLVGQAELLGFDWFDRDNQPLKTIPAGTVATLRLYWEWQGRLEEDMIRVSLVDSAGYTWGWSNLVDERRIQTGRAEGEVVVDDYALAIFPGTPPGEYYLSAWIERAVDGAVIGQFPLTPEEGRVIVAPPLVPANLNDIEVDERLESQFGPLQLLGYNFATEVWEPGQQRTLELFWSKPQSNSSAETHQPEIAKLILVPHAPLSQEDHSMIWERLITPAYPPSRWQPGDQFRDLWPLTLPRYMPKGRYDLQLIVANEKQTIGQIDVGGRERLFETPNISQPLPARLGKAIKFLGYNLQFEDEAAEAKINLALFWQAEAVPDGDYTVFAQLLDANNQIVAQRDSQPQGGAASTGTWAIGEIIPDTYILVFEPLPERMAYRLIVGLYRPETGERLPVAVDGPETDALTLTTLEINGR